MKKIELLAPAGSMESFKAALYAGCDAVYMGGSSFGARNYATNFTEEELQEVVSLAHLYGVKIYITVNTLVYEMEVKAFMKYIDFLVSIHVDALIMQDLGMVDLVHQTYPDMELHASTQMHIHTKEGVLFAQKLGMKRAVIAREVSIDQIKDIKKNTNIELEVFGHGALCIGYSGQCLMSSLIGGRSGNRGTCAQSCRKSYLLKEGNRTCNKDAYIISTKDLNTLDHMEEFIASGIDSLKIEGRMKRPEYVYAVVSLYRKAIDSYYENGVAKIKPEEITDIKKLFNRSFTKGFLFHEENHAITYAKRPNHMGIKIGTVTGNRKGKLEITLTSNLSKKDGIRILDDREDYGCTVGTIFKKGTPITDAFEGDKIELPITVPLHIGDIVLKTSDEKQLCDIQKLIEEKNRKIPVAFEITIEKNKPLVLEGSDGVHKVQVIGTTKIPEACSNPAEKKDIEHRLSKLGGTIYTLESIKVHMKDKVFVPIKELNEIRREAVEKLNEARLQRKSISKGKYEKIVPTFMDTKEESIFIHTYKQYQFIKEYSYTNIYAEEELYKKIAKDPRVCMRLPRVMTTYPTYKEKVLVCEVGSILSYKQVETDSSLNVTNSYTLALLHSFGVSKVTVSSELNDYALERMITSYQERYGKNPNVEVVVYGKEEAMITKYNILDAYHIKEGILEDSFGNTFPIRQKKDYNTIYFYKATKKNNIDFYYHIGVHSVRFNVLEDSELMEDVCLGQK